MPQSGFHGLVGLGVARNLTHRVPRVVRANFVFGLVLGAVLPDIDMYPTALAVLLGGSDQIYVFHRTASHSIFAVLLCGLLAWAFRGRPAWGWTLWGLAIGALTHDLLDIFFWFAQIDIMWPFSQGPVAHGWFNLIDIWPQGFKGLVSNIRDAFEFAAFALFVGAIRRIVQVQRGFGVDLDQIVWWELAMWVCFVVAIVTACVYRAPADAHIQQLVVNVPYLIAFLPYSWSRIWVYRNTIAEWANATPPNGTIK